MSGKWIFVISLSFLIHTRYAFDCEFEFTDVEGVIESPGYPKPYSNSLKCSWKIFVPLGRHIVLQSKNFDVENSFNCRADVLYIYDGPSDRSKLLDAPYCGNKKINIASSRNSIFIRFITDNWDSKNGFSIKYTSFKTCDFEIDKPSGYITSPKYPKVYDANANCSYMIKTTPGKVILLQFHDFSLENAVKGDCLDFVSIYNVQHNEKSFEGRYCGDELPHSVWSTSNKLLVKFQSDKIINKKGFNASFSSVYPGCGRNEFNCGNKNCISLNLRCNGVADCMNRADEMDCGCNGFTCQNGNCINEKLTCDGTDHCGDNSDELKCLAQTTSRPMDNGASITTQRPCGFTQYQCTNKRCVDKQHRCNGKNDCGDNSDESDCKGQCKILNGDCDHICTYDKEKKCSCYPGFVIDQSDKNKCIDVNECSSRPCDHICKNVIGSFKCLCRSGFRLAEDGLKCVDFNECSLKSYCEQKCINKYGTYECSCFDGYKLNPKTNICEDVDECLLDNGGCAEKCENSIGSYRCVCDKQGYEMLPGQTKCRDRDECKSSENKCEQECLNTDGGYWCACRKGFFLMHDGHSCQDIDECLVGPGCLGRCINTIGSYKCICDEGHELTGEVNCTDIDECSVDNGKCSQLCINTPGSFRCQCQEGYVGRDSASITCDDKDECLDSLCEGSCKNYIGTFRCSCPEGSEVFNRTLCRDVDECQMPEVNNCQYNCTNIDPGFICTCPDNYILEADNVSCRKVRNGTGCKRVHVDTGEISRKSWSPVVEGWPWQVTLSIYYPQLTLVRTNCMGVLVSEQHVLTTAHCLSFGPGMNISANNLMLSMGSFVYGYHNQENFHATHIVYHPRLDLALIQLREKAVTEDIQPACLPQGPMDVDLQEGKRLLAVTWSSDHKRLEHTLVKIQPFSKCSRKASDGNLDETKQICVKFSVHELRWPMSGSVLLGLFRGSTSLQQKWLVTGVLIRGGNYPGIVAWKGAPANIVYERVYFTKWIHDVIAKR